MLSASLTALAKAWSLPAPTIDQAFVGVSIDSRQDNTGRLFVAIVGAHADGHDYLQAAKASGAVAAFVNRVMPMDMPQLVVDDTRLALGWLGKLARAKLHAKVIGLTGSCGKTTTKSLIASICRQAGMTAATRGTLNNDFGVPITLAEIPSDAEFAVIEMGANHQQEIAYLTDIVSPHVALITNVGPVHLEGFGSLAGVAQGKSEIFEGLLPEGTAVINRDDAYAESWIAQTKMFKQITFGLHPQAMVRGENITMDVDDKPHFTLHTPAGSCEVHLQLLGYHNALNALAAAAAAFAADIPLNLIQAGLAAQTSVDKRMVLTPGLHGAQLLDDTYNANPLAMEMALRMLARKPGKRIFVMGDMGELGPDSALWHKQVGELAKTLGIDELFAVGTQSVHAVAGFGQGAQHFADKALLIKALQTQLTPNTIVLIKGSRSANMEQVVAALQAHVTEES